MALRIILTAFLSTTCTYAFAGVEPSIDEVEKLNNALAAVGCTGGEMQKNTGDMITYAVENSLCEKGQFDLVFDKDFNVLKKNQD